VHPVIEGINGEPVLVAVLIMSISLLDIDGAAVVVEYVDELVLLLISEVSDELLYHVIVRTGSLNSLLGHSRYSIFLFL
jgi:hypothetical protein